MNRSRAKRTDTPPRKQHSYTSADRHSGIDDIGYTGTCAGVAEAGREDDILEDLGDETMLRFRCDLITVNRRTGFSMT